MTEEQRSISSKVPLRRPGYKCAPGCRTLRAPSGLRKERTPWYGRCTRERWGKVFQSAKALKARMNSAPLRREMSVDEAKISAQKTLFENVGRRRGGGKGHRRRKDNGHKVKRTSRIGASMARQYRCGESLLKAEDHMMPSSRSFCCHFQAVVSESSRVCTAFQPSTLLALSTLPHTFSMSPARRGATL